MMITNKDKYAGEYMTSSEKFIEIMRTLRSENGCPWDRVQTHSSLKASCIEEAAELVCAVNVFEKTGNAENLKEELGDMLMVLTLQCLIAEDEGLFTIDDVLSGISEKMIRRHPNVFAGESIELERQKELWEEIKKEEKIGKEDVEEMLPSAFEESLELIKIAQIRKGFVC